VNFLVCLMLAGLNPTERATQRANDSGRVLLLGADEIERPRVPPGIPPLLKFRYWEGSARHQFGDLDLVVDDAGH